MMNSLARNTVNAPSVLGGNEKQVAPLISEKERLAKCIEVLNRLKGHLAGQRDPRNVHWINLIKKALE